MWTKLMPIQFTELWFDVKDTDKVMNCLKEYWSDNEGLKHTGTFSCEMYPAMTGGYGSNEVYQGPPGGAWLRPNFGYKVDKNGKKYAVGRPVFRIDILWFDVKTQEPYMFFTPLWDKLIKAGLHFRPHWAKYLPGGNVSFPAAGYRMWRDYYRSQYPMWDKFMKLRKELDPANIFVSDYWADTLGIDIQDVDDPFNAPKNPNGDPTAKPTATEIMLAQSMEDEKDEEDP